MERLQLFGVFVLHSKTFITFTYPVFLAELEINHECPCCLFRHDLFEKKYLEFKSQFSRQNF